MCVSNKEPPPINTDIQTARLIHNLCVLNAEQFAIHKDHIKKIKNGFNLSGPRSGDEIFFVYEEK